jgi:hypothetical protein
MRAPRAARCAARRCAPLLLLATLLAALSARAGAETSSSDAASFDSAPVHSAAAGAAYVTGCLAQARTRRALGGVHGSRARARSLSGAARPLSRAH